MERNHMAPIFITGSADGLGRATAQTLLDLLDALARFTATPLTTSR